MKISRNTVYEHEEYGEVLVVGVHHVFGEYDLEAESGEVSSRVVRYTDDWDGYGPMPSSMRGTPVREFRTAIGNALRTVEFVQPGKQNEDGA